MLPLLPLLPLQLLPFCCHQWIHGHSLQIESHHEINWYFITDPAATSSKWNREGGKPEDYIDEEEKAKEAEEDEDSDEDEAEPASALDLMQVVS